MSLKFLNKKQFHPTNKHNQKKKFIAEENDKARIKRELERAKEQQEELEFIKNKELLTGSKTEADKLKVGFLYAPPPGYIPENQPQPQESLIDNDNNNHKSKDKLTDVEKFPFLAGAPVAGDYRDQVKLVHKPFGIQLRDVKCARCGNFGHCSGERECPLNQINPLDSKRLQHEDPLYKPNNNKNHNNSGNVNNNNNNNNQKSIRVNPNASSPTKQFGGGNQVYELIEEPEEEKQTFEINNDDDDDEIERKFLASLTKHQRKILLRQIKLEEKQRKKDKKRKKQKKNNSDDSSFSDSSNNSSEEEEDKR
ncbi:hypothetical protein DLAC_02311 [Tieghemostelium lacteum]|uniref:CBF1-interacting co-repressor CIR N-terminal domain-containing protein n=1 Tax=Tieghemostelium lacteum TaxID=361077 RepID=A0A152A4P5_TIELA|nr:hypothetical protein DLAC_02311 [Tieghemostelium lacteum]|eukprot:KYR01194.1 hypothetical protein DLAC_02311 [Tieghemostelium lacteum]